MTKRDHRREEEVNRQPNVDLAGGESEVIHPTLTPREPERNIW